MKYIMKNSEPTELIEYKKTPGVCYETMASTPTVRDAVKKSSLEEQGYICCYCGTDIHFDSSTILEHLLPRKIYPHMSLAYDNILASCDGGQAKRTERDEEGHKKNRKYPSFCDDKKGNNIIPITPLTIGCEEQFYFDEEGNIYNKSDDAKETIRKLNLDNPVLCNRRKGMIDLYREINKTKADFLNTYHNIMKKGSDGKYIPFCFAVKSYIENFEL